MAFPLPTTLRAAKRPEQADATPRTPLAARARRVAARALPRLAGLRTAALTTAGFATIDAGVWQINHIAGTIAAGVSLLLLEALSGGEG